MTLPERLVVNPRYDVYFVPPATAVLCNEHEQVALEGAFAAHALAQCRAPVALADLRAALATEHTGLETSVGMARLVERGYLVDAVDVDGVLTAYAARAGLRLGEPSLVVAVDDLGLGLAEQLRTSLRGLGMQLLPEGDRNAELVVVVTDDYLRDGLAERNGRQLADGRPWALVKPVGVDVWLGPVFVPGETGCWECLAARLRDNRQVESYLQRRLGGFIPPPRAVSVPAIESAATGLAAVMLLQWARGDGQVEAGTLTTLDTRTLITRRHQLIRLPHCTACGSTPVRQIRLPEVDDATVLHASDGALRTQSPGATIARLDRHVSPVLGIVNEVLEYDTGDDIITVHRASHPLFTPRGDVDSLRETLHSTTAGKGRTREQSKASALCEALERAAGRFRGYEVDVRSAWSGLQSQAVHPDRLLQFSERQYRGRQDWNPQHSGFAWVPERFDRERPVDWTAAWSLTTDNPVLLPTAFCYYDAPLERGHVFCSADSNGCAAGDTIGEAILQGFYELVERDAVAIWWYNRLAAPSVDLASVEDPQLAMTIEAYASRNREMWVLDVTSDLGVPTYVAVSRRLDSREEIIQGYGAHADPHIALWRAVTEMSQMLAHLGNADLAELPDRDLREWYASATLAGHPELAPGPRTPWTPSPVRPRSAAREVEWCVDLARSSGLDFLVLDQTRAEADLRVVKVVVPGLRHFWPRFAAGRLYDVPVARGQLAQPCREEELNPVPICT